MPTSFKNLPSMWKTHTVMTMKSVTNMRCVKFGRNFHGDEVRVQFVVALHHVLGLSLDFERNNMYAH